LEKSQSNPVQLVKNPHYTHFSPASVNFCAMLKKNGRRLAFISAAFSLFVSLVFAVIEKQTVRYEHTIRAIRGKVTAVGQPIPVTVWVDVYDNAQVRLDDSIPQIEQRKRQAKVASAEANDKGEFRIQHLPKGFYEVEVGNHGSGGYHVLSVLVNIDPRGANDKLCVDLSLEGGNAQSTVAKCGTN
jgi:hypothetical protein